MKRVAVAIALTALVSACGPRNYVVLLDNPGGGSGKVIVANAKGSRTLEQAGTATAINRRGSAPSKPWLLKVEKIQEVFARAFGARPARYLKFTIYFKSGDSVIDPHSNADLRAMLDEVARRPGVDATVAGHADRAASQAYNAKVSLKRAYKIRDELVRAGVPIERIEIDNFGETRPAVPTPDDVSERRNRRVEVTVR
jgi:peptidoglycan-associated lipoprotein